MANQNIITPTFRCSFPELFEAKKMEGTAGEPKFSVVMVFPKTVDIKALKDLAAAAIEEKYGRDPVTKKLKTPPNFRNPFRDGDTEMTAEGAPKYPGCIFVSASSQKQPGIVGPANVPLTNPNEVYGGMYARAYVNCYVYDKSGNRGVAFGLQALQKTKDGEPFGGGRVNPTTVFSPVEEEAGEAAPATAENEW